MRTEEEIRQEMNEVEAEINTEKEFIRELMRRLEQEETTE